MNTTKIPVLIVDDEPLARDELSRLILEDGSFEVAAQAGSGEEALAKLKADESIRVVFLDIDMPGPSGLQVASRLSDWPDPPLVVFATAYNQYAVEAFETSAIDYILKPYDPERLKKTFAKIKHSTGRKGESREKLQALDQHLVQKQIIKKLVGHERNRKDRILIHPEEVYFFHARFTEVTARLKDRDLVVNATLKDLLLCLDAERFAQTHKAYIVNLDKVEKVSPMFSGNFEVSLRGIADVKIPLSRRYSRQVKSLLGNW